MKSLRICFIPLIFACVYAASHAGEVSFLQAPLEGGGSFLSEPDSDQNSDNFSFASSTRITSVRWWGVYITSQAELDNFTLRFFNPISGSPEMTPFRQYTNLIVNRIDSGFLDSFGDIIYEYEAELTSSLIFNAGATGFISVLNSTVNGWFWQKSNNSDSNWFRLDDLDPWVEAAGVTRGNLAFELMGITPPGNFDNDSDVDGRDFLFWQRGVSPISLSVIDINDWKSSYGSNLAELSSWRLVPEGSLVTHLVILVLIGFTVCRRHHLGKL